MAGLAVFVVLGIWQQPAPPPVPDPKKAEAVADLPAAEPVSPAAANSPPAPSPVAPVAAPSLAAGSMTAIWEEVVPEAEVPMAIKDKRLEFPAARLVKLDLPRLQALQAGDNFEIQIPQLETGQTIWINTVEVLPSGNKSLTGYVDGNEMLGFVMTLGQDTLFATIWTDSGGFNLDGRGNLAWLVADRELRAKIDTSVPDYK